MHKAATSISGWRALVAAATAFGLLLAASVAPAQDGKGDAGKKGTGKKDSGKSDAGKKAGEPAKDKDKTTPGDRDKKPAPGPDSGVGEDDEIIDTGTGSGEAAEAKADGQADPVPKPKAAKGKTYVDDATVQLVKDNLAKFLSPSKIEWLKDGRVTMEFNFREKNEEHASIFNLPIGAKMTDIFRWTIREEEWVIGGEPGIRLSNKGMVLLKAWYTDDVEAEMEFLQYINHTPKHLAAIAFTGRGKAIGANYGSQCAVFVNGKVDKAVGATDPVPFEKCAKFKLVVKDGQFEAHREGKLRNKMSYARAPFASGQIAVIWGGSIAAIVPRLTITGRLDHARMGAEIKKFLGK